VPAESRLEGMKVRLAPLADMLPGTAWPVLEVSPSVKLLAVLGSMDSLKATAMGEPKATELAPLIGLVEITVGATRSL
jgi:hypothetical protein